MKIKAKFKGTTDKNYKNGIRYSLDFDTVSIFGTLKRRVEIVKTNDWVEGYKSTVQYASLRKFLDNWEVL